MERLVIPRNHAYHNRFSYQRLTQLILHKNISKIGDAEP